MPTVLEPAPGLRLRRWRDDDLDALLRHADDAEVARGLSDRFPHPYTRADGVRFLSGQVVPLDHVFAIEIAGEACGGIGVRQIGTGERRHGAEFGYWLGRTHWGQGRMTQVVAAFVPWIMRELALYRLQATVHDRNPASARVLLKNGFVEEGTLRCAILKHGRLGDLRLFAKVRRSLEESP